MHQRQEKVPVAGCLARFQKFTLQDVSALFRVVQNHASVRPVVKNVTFGFYDGDKVAALFLKTVLEVVPVAEEVVAYNFYLGCHRFVPPVELSDHNAFQLFFGFCKVICLFKLASSTLNC